MCDAGFHVVTLHGVTLQVKSLEYLRFFNVLVSSAHQVCIYLIRNIVTI